MEPSKEAMEAAFSLHVRHASNFGLCPGTTEIAKLLDAFAAAAVAREREECAKECYGVAASAAYAGVSADPEDYAEAIRSRAATERKE